MKIKSQTAVTINIFAYGVTIIASKNKSELIGTLMGLKLNQIKSSAKMLKIQRLTFFDNVQNQ